MEQVVLVHGIWMKPPAMAYLSRRLRAAGFDPTSFSYGSLRRTPREAAGDLGSLLRSLGSPVVHLVAHSLGGVVVLHAASRGLLPPSGRVVFLGVPVGGSAVARVLAARRATRALLGRGAEGGLLDGAPPWRGGRDLGVIAGTRALGVGRLVARLPRPNDGTVAVAETRVPGATDRLALPVSHTGLLVSRAVADAAGVFLRTGAFPPRS